MCLPYQKSNFRERKFTKGCLTLAWDIIRKFVVLPDECGAFFLGISPIYMGVIGQENVVLRQGMKKKDEQEKTF